MDGDDERPTQSEAKRLEQEADGMEERLDDLDDDLAQARKKADEHADHAQDALE